MPTKNVYIKPRVLMRYKGTTIYYTYDHGEWEEENKWHYCTKPEDADEGDQFDVRELDTWVEPPHPPYLTGKNKNSNTVKRAWEVYHQNDPRPQAIKNAIKNMINLKGVAGLYDL